MTYTDEAQIIFSILADKPVAYHPRLAKAVGGVKQAIFVCQLLYWHGKGADPDGWIFKTQADIERETGLSRREQETVRKTLVSKKILEEKRRGIPATMHYRLNLNNLYQCIYETYLQHDPDKQDCTNPPNWIGASVQSINRNPESTAENTLPPPAKTTQPTPQPLTADDYKQRIAAAMQRGQMRDQSIRDAVRTHLRVNPNWNTKTGRALMKHLKERAAVGETVRAFAEWWWEHDWRGRKNQPPSTNQIMEMWPAAFARESLTDELPGDWTI